MILNTLHLTIGYGSIPVQTDLNLRADAGTLICMLGKNGCGKSTLLRTLAGLQPALGGQILLDNGRDLSSLSQQEKARLLSLVLTERISQDNTPVRDIVAMGRYPYSSFLGTLSETDEKEIRFALTQVEMLHKAASFFNCLSDGEKQRVLVAKALAQQTPLILLDEPTAHLDLPNRIKTLLLLRQLAHHTHKCVIISTHELDLALQMADEIWLMTPHEGIQKGTPEELVSSGAFQTAFRDPSFSFVENHGSLSLLLNKDV